MSRHEDSRSTAVIDRPLNDAYRGERFEDRLNHQHERYGPPARVPHRHHDSTSENEYLVYTDNPRRRFSPSPHRPRFLRRQSSLDTFERVTSRARRAGYDISPPPPPPPAASSDYYDGIGIAEPEYYGDEEYRDFHDIASPVLHDSFYHQQQYYRPYPRRGKTRFPKRHVHIRAIMELGYPFQEESEKITILLALSKDQIDELIELSREWKRRSEVNRITYYRPAAFDSPSPSMLSPDERLLIEPSRRRSLRLVTRHSSPPPPRRLIELGDGRDPESEILVARRRDDYYDDYHNSDDEVVNIRTRRETMLDDGERERIIETERNRKGRVNRTPVYADC